MHLHAKLLVLLSINAAAAVAAITGDPVSDALASLRFLHAGVITPDISGNLTRLYQCSGFSECRDAWTCGSPRDYVYDTSAGRTEPRVPPMGVRSAIPLGGFGAGTFELRADGSFADFMIEGQGTGLAANAVQNSKLPLKGEAFLGLYGSHSDGGGSFAVALRTDPPAGLPGVQALEYGGAFPFSRLRINDTRAPFSAAALFAYSSFAPANATGANASALPAAIFSVVLSAPADAPGPINASLLLSLPLGSSEDTDRPLLDVSDPRKQVLARPPGLNATGCMAACEAYGAQCVWWTHSGSGSPNITASDHDCAGDDIYTPPRIAFATLAECIDQCVLRVPGCNGLVYDQIASEQAGQCDNTNATLFCCLPKSSCTNFGNKKGDTAWAAGTLGDVCTLFSKAPAVEQHRPGSGARNGVRGFFSSSVSPAGLHGLTLRRPNAYDADPTAAFQDAPAATASYTLLAVDSDASVSFATADDIATGIWPSFAATGALSDGAVNGVMAAHGAIAARVLLYPGETRSISIVFAWHLPNRMYVGQELGNAYAAAGGMNDSESVAGVVAAALPSIVSGGFAFNTMWTQSTLPVWMADFMMNSVAILAKMSVWVAKGADGAPLPGGRFRQFEAFSGCDLAPVHVLDYSMLPYVLMFPELLMNTLLTGWAARQQGDGMIKEFLGDFSAPGGRLTGPMDTSAGGRTMGDVTTVFLLATLACFRSTNSSSFLVAMWPSVVRAAQWQIARSTAFGCPNNLQTTYDYLGLDVYPLASYNAFLHNAAMRAVVKLAAARGDNSLLARNATASEAACLATISSALWHSNATAADPAAGWWRAWQTSDRTAPNLIMSGSLHGQSWASALGLGLLVPAANVSAHLVAETALNCAYSPEECELGLLTLHTQGTQWSEDASPAQSMDASAAALIVDAANPLRHAESVVRLYRENLNDLWHWMDLHIGPGGLSCDADLSGSVLAGQPFVNSHYARQLQGWAAFLAWSGQQFDATEGTLLLRPRCTDDSDRNGGNDDSSSSIELAVIPFLTPRALGTIRVVSRADTGVVDVSLRLLRGELAPSWLTRVTVDLGRCRSASLLSSSSGSYVTLDISRSISVGEVVRLSSDWPCFRETPLDDCL